MSLLCPFSFAEQKGNYVGRLLCHLPSNVVVPGELNLHPRPCPWYTIFLCWKGTLISQPTNVTDAQFCEIGPPKGCSLEQVVFIHTTLLINFFISMAVLCCYVFCILNIVFFYFVALFSFLCFIFATFFLNSLIFSRLFSQFDYQYTWFIAKGDVLKSTVNVEFLKILYCTDCVVIWIWLFVFFDSCEVWVVWNTN